MARGNRLLVDLVVDRYVNLDLFYRLQQTQATGCVTWTGVTNNAGYGFIGFKSVDRSTGEPRVNSTRMMTVHRLAWMIHHGRLPDQPNVNHTCHNKLCVNPEHLQTGTQREKLVAMQQAGIKGGARLGVTRGPYLKRQQREYRYTEAEIQWIRSATAQAIAERYGISKLKASNKRSSFRAGYRWLPEPAYEPQRRGRPRLRNK